MKSIRHDNEKSENVTYRKNSERGSGDRSVAEIWHVSKRVMKSIRHGAEMWLLHLFICLVAIVSCALPTAADPVVKPEQGYSEFFSEIENFFLFRPILMKKAFYGMSVLQGDPKVARFHIEKEIFSCGAGAAAYTNCPIGRFKTKKRQQKVSNAIRVAVNISRIESRKYKKGMKVVSLFWNPTLLVPPALDIREFLSLLNVAKESKYFQIEESLKRIRFNAVFQRKIELVLDATLADNLIGSQRSCEREGRSDRWKCMDSASGVYSTIPLDRRDRFTFVLDSSDFDILDETGSFTIFLKATRVKINQQHFAVRSERVL